MNSRSMAIRAGLGLSALVAMTPASGQPTVPFVWAPPATNYFVRVDFAALESTPAFAPLVERLSAANPRYSTETLSFMDREIGPFGDIAKAIPGRLKAIEFATSVNVSDPKVWTQVERPPVTLALVPEGDFSALGSNLTSQRWTLLNTANSGVVYTDTRRRLYASTPTPSTIAINAELRAVPPTVGPDGAAGFTPPEVLGTLLDKPFFALAILTADDQANLATLATTPPKEAWAIAGLPEAIREAGALRHAAIAATGRQNAQLDVLLGFADNAAAQRAGEALNRAIPAMAALGRQQAGNDPQAIAQIDYIASLRFAAQDSTLQLSFELPPEFFETVGDAIAAQLPAPDGDADAAPTQLAAADAMDTEAAAADDPNAPIKIELLDEPIDSAPADEMPTRPQARPDTAAAKRGNALGSMVGAMVAASADDAPANDGGDELTEELRQGFAKSMIQPKHARRDFPIRRTVDYEGMPFVLTEYRGKVVLVDYWATWCPASREVTPQLVNIHRSLKYQGLEMVGVSLDVKSETAKAYAEANGLNWPHLCDERGWDSEYSRSMGVSSIPCLTFLDKRGRVAAEDVPLPLAEAVARELLAEPD